MLDICGSIEKHSVGVIHLPQLFWVNLCSPAKTAGVVAFPLGKNCQRRNCPLSGGEQKGAFPGAKPRVEKSGEEVYVPWQAKDRIGAC